MVVVVVLVVAVVVVVVVVVVVGDSSSGGVVVVVVVVAVVKVMEFEAQTYISIHRGTSPMVEACVRDPRVKTATICDLCTRPSTALVCAGD